MVGWREGRGQERSERVNYIIAMPDKDKDRRGKDAASPEQEDNKVEEEVKETEVMKWL